MLFELLKAGKVGGGVDFYHDILARNLAGSLPPGYELVESAYNTSDNVLVHTGFKPDVDDIDLEIRVKARAGSFYLYQARASITGSVFGISGSATGDTITGGFPRGNTVTSTISRRSGRIYLIQFSAKNGHGSITVTEEETGTTDTKTMSYGSFSETNADICLFGNTAGNHIAKNTAIYYAKMRKSGELVMHYAPCVHENTVGFWDFVTKTFVTPTSGTLAAG